MGFLSRIFSYLLPLLLLLLLSCNGVSESEAELLSGDDLVSREAAKEIFRVGVRINLQLCPEYIIPALYAQEAVIPEELTRPHYTKKSIQVCQVALMLTPCGMNPEDTTVIQNLYRSVIRGCGPKSPTFY